MVKIRLILKKCFTAVIALAIILPTSACGVERVDTLTYAVFPYLPDVGYYQELIESRWAEVEPEIKLVRAEWDCYLDGVPEGIDVIMYDASLRDTLIANKRIRPISRNAVKDSEDIFPFALDGFAVGDNLYGIPIFLCGNFLIYDLDSEKLAAAAHITDLSDASEILVINSEDPMNRPQYIAEAAADIQGEANSSAYSDPEDIMLLIDRLAIDSHKHDDNTGVAMAYDSGADQGYIGYSESMCLLKNRIDRTGIKSISFSDRENTLRLYADAAAVTSGIKGLRCEKCLELMNVMSDINVLTSLSVHEGAPQFLLLARKTPYESLADQFPIYKDLEYLASNEKNHVVLTP
ncbi:MAG: hypothetical protein II881_05885 [Oscillospiraceae bacterium]|nr:hypothetical protein [Oscillospiraceae bacterium]